LFLWHYYGRELSFEHFSGLHWHCPIEQCIACQSSAKLNPKAEADNVDAEIKPLIIFSDPRLG